MSYFEKQKNPWNLTHNSQKKKKKNENFFWKFVDYSAAVYTKHDSHIHTSKCQYQQLRLFVASGDNWISFRDGFTIQCHVIDTCVCVCVWLFFSKFSKVLMALTVSRSKIIFEGLVLVNNILRKSFFVQIFVDFHLKNKCVWFPWNPLSTLEHIDPFSHDVFYVCVSTFICICVCRYF